MSTFLNRHAAGTAGQSTKANENYLLLEVLSGANPVKGITLSYNTPGVSIANALEKQLTYNTADGATAVTPVEGDAYIVANWGVELRFRNDAPATITSGASGTPLDASGNTLGHATANNGIDLAGCLPSDWRTAADLLPLPGDLMIYDGSEWLHYQPQEGWEITLAQDAVETDVCYVPGINKKADGSTVQADGDGDTVYSNVNVVGSPSRGRTLTYKTAKTFNAGTEGYEDWLFLTPKDAAAANDQTALNVATSLHSPGSTYTEGLVQGRWAREAVVTTDVGYTPSDATNYSITSITAATTPDYTMVVEAGAVVAVGDIVSYAREASATAYASGELAWALEIMSVASAGTDTYTVTFSPARYNYDYAAGTGHSIISGVGFDTSASLLRGGTLLFSNNDLGLCDTGTEWYQVPGDGSGETYQCKNFYAKQRTWKGITTATGGGGGGTVDHAVKVVNSDNGAFTAVGEDTLNILGMSGAGLSTEITAGDVLTVKQSRAAVDTNGYLHQADFAQFYATTLFNLTREVKGLGTTTVPGSPSVGDAYIVGPSPASGWNTFDNHLVVWDGNAWISLGERSDGMRVFVTSTGSPLSGIYASYPSEFAGEELQYDASQAAWFPVRDVSSTTPHFTGRYLEISSVQEPLWAWSFQEQAINTLTGPKNQDTGTRQLGTGVTNYATFSTGEYLRDVLGVRAIYWLSTSNELGLVFADNTSRANFFNDGTGNSKLQTGPSTVTVQIDANTATDQTFFLDLEQADVTNVTNANLPDAVRFDGTVLGLKWDLSSYTTAVKNALNDASTSNPAYNLAVIVETGQEHTVEHGLSLKSGTPVDVKALMNLGSTKFQIGGFLVSGASSFPTSVIATATLIKMNYSGFAAGSAAQQIHGRVEYIPA
jgi:hypothetical protein